MGTDVDLQSGVLVHYLTVVKMLELSKQGVELVKEQLLSDTEFCETISSFKAWFSEPDQSGFVETGNAKTWLEKVRSHHTFQAWLCRWCEANQCEIGRYEQYDMDDLVERSIALPVRLAASHMGIEMPRFQVRAFANSKLTNLWNIELGHVYFDFRVEDCFEFKLTEMGAALQKQLDVELDVSEWATVSY
ncbi:hypothetical protein CA13_60200 [Planctomycetes bacterium CA13]|uniref:Uncharacterized protein n=1 Tax=Novipirellula herctigrandis TaxID=2527986 RepID=A0A5C5ZBJ4_9BACT|nr:hypothetical protein CA13_60200 [Planctomycetes bacterium CA13]